MGIIFNFFVRKLTVVLDLRTVLFFADLEWAVLTDHDGVITMVGLEGQLLLGPEKLTVVLDF
jgi:hypothetical protein